MIAFKDLIFKDHPIGDGFKASYVFDNEYEVSVVAGKFFYSTPRENLSSAEDYSGFEIAIFNKKGDYCTGELCACSDDVVGYCSKTDISNLMEIAQQL